MGFFGRTFNIKTNTQLSNNDGNRKYEFLQEKSYLEFAVDEDYSNWGKCRLSIAKQEFFKVNFALALPTASPLKTILDKK